MPRVSLAFLTYEKLTHSDRLTYAELYMQHTLTYVYLTCSVHPTYVLRISMYKMLGPLRHMTTYTNVL